MTKQQDNNQETAQTNDAIQIAQSLKLAILQIDTSMREAGNSVELLIESITSIASDLQRIQSQLEKTDSGATLQSECSLMDSHVQQSIIAFQFYDRLSQRFSHISQNLAEVISVISAPECEHPALWRNLQKRMRAVYSLEQEQTMYRALLDGLPAEDSDHNTGTMPQRAAASDTELF